MRRLILMLSAFAFLFSVNISASSSTEKFKDELTKIEKVTSVDLVDAKFEISTPKELVKEKKQTSYVLFFALCPSLKTEVKSTLFKPIDNLMVKNKNKNFYNSIKQKLIFSTSGGLSESYS